MSLSGHSKCWSFFADETSVRRKGRRKRRHAGGRGEEDFSKQRATKFLASPSPSLPTHLAISTAAAKEEEEVGVLVWVVEEEDPGRHFTSCIFTTMSVDEKEEEGLRFYSHGVFFFCVLQNIYLFFLRRYKILISEDYISVVKAKLS